MQLVTCYWDIMASFAYQKSTMVATMVFWVWFNRGWSYGWTMVKNHGSYTMVQPYG